MAETFHAPATKEWAPIVDGAVFSRVGIQFDKKRIEIYSGSAVPTAETDDFVALGPDNSREIVIGLTATEKVYVRCASVVAIAVRGFREVRA